MMDKSEKFKIIAERRVNNTLKSIQLIGNLSNTGNYEYSTEDISKIFKTLREEMQIAESRFKITSKKKKFKF